MEDHISRKSVLVLVVLALVVSALSTTMVLNAVSHLSSTPKQAAASTTPTASVQLTVPNVPITAHVTLTVR
ncbi:MAG: hypothetical protein Q7S65_05735 [Nanoarchaeota archaeon]|nr:hypothetical protein [Nanoarchaeota archaeon]